MQQWQVGLVVAWCLALGACAGASSSRGGSTPQGGPSSNVQLAPGTPADAIDLVAAGEVLNRHTAAILRCYQQRRQEGAPSSDAYLYVTLDRSGHVTEVSARGPEFFEGCAREVLTPVPFPLPTVAQVMLIQFLHIYSSQDVAGSPIGVALNDQIRLHYPDFGACHAEAYPTAPRPAANLTVTFTVHPDRHVSQVHVTPPSPMEACVRAVVSRFDLPAHPDGLVQTLSFTLMLR